MSKTYHTQTARTEALCPPHETNFQNWKTVTVGNLGNAKARKKLESHGIKVSSWGDDILNRMEFEETKSLDLVQVSVKKLGLEDGATTAEIYAAAERHGLSLCPAEVAP